MKKGFTTLQVVVSLVLVMLFAFGVVFGIFPRFERGQAFGEELFPETCEETGRTQAEYESMILDAVASRRQDPQKALDLYNEMNFCFPGAKVPERLTEGTTALLKSRLKKLRTPKLSSLQEVMKIYDDSQGIIPESAWDSDELLLFARALFHADKGRNSEAFDLLESVKKHKKSEDKHQAEALAMQGLLYPYVGTGELDPYFAAAAKYKEPEFFVGIAKIGIGEQDKGAELLKKAMASAPLTSGTYESYSAAYRLIQYHNQVQEGDKAAEIFHKTFAVTAFKDSIFYEPSAKEYVKIDKSLRKSGIPDCQIDKTVTDVCVCNTQQGIFFLPMNDLVNCCYKKPSIVSESCECVAGPESCACLNKINLKCEGYKSKLTCESDVCKFKDVTQVFGCRWTTPKGVEPYCFTKYEVTDPGGA